MARKKKHMEINNDTEQPIELNETIEDVTPIVVAENSRLIPYGKIAIKSKKSGEIIFVSKNSFGTTYKPEKWELVSEDKKK